MWIPFLFYASSRRILIRLLFKSKSKSFINGEVLFYAKIKMLELIVSKKLYFGKSKAKK